MRDYQSMIERVSESLPSLNFMLSHMVNDMFGLVESEYDSCYTSSLYMFNYYYLFAWCNHGTIDKRTYELDFKSLVFAR